MNNNHIVILGGGFGGVAAASTLALLLSGKGRITLVDRSPYFLVGATKTWVMLGERTPEQVKQSRAGLQESGVELMQAEITRIDVENGVVVNEAGELRPDHLVVALGASLNMGAVPGLEGAAHTFYTLDEAQRLNGVLERFEGGSATLLIPRAPFKCPPAPYEAAMLLQDYFARRGLSARARLDIYTVEGAPMATAGPQMGAMVREELARRGIGFHPLKKTVSVDGAERRIQFEDGGIAGYDLLIAIPPHEAPGVVREAGLTGPSGWIAVDPQTFRLSGAGGKMAVYAVGDNIALPLPGRFNPEVPLALPKAGVMAEAQGRIVGQQIAAQVLGTAAEERFDGSGACYIETGGGRAIRAEGHFFAMPHPHMEVEAESEAAYAEKVRWAEGWLREQVSS